LPLVSPKRTVWIVLYSGFARFALLLHASCSLGCLWWWRYICQLVRPIRGIRHCWPNILITRLHDFVVSSLLVRYNI